MILKSALCSTIDFMQSCGMFNAYHGNYGNIYSPVQH